MTERKTILFLTNWDFGQSNVVLAVAYELLRQNEFDIHIASWSPLEPRVTELCHHVQLGNPKLQIRPITFHTFPLSSMFDSWLKRDKNRKKADLPHPPGINGAARLTDVAIQVLDPWEPDEHIELYEWCRELAQSLNPALIVLDPFLGPAHDACRMLDWKHAILSPCTLASGIIPEQPWFAGFWKYPALSTGFPYPLPWSKIPENIYCIWAAIRCLWHPEIKALDRVRREHGIRGRLSAFTPWIKEVPHICPSLPEIDLPMIIPSNVHYCGPILLTATPVSESDPELLSWLQKRPTVLMVLGTHHEARADIVREQALGLRILLEARLDLQVLWKLKVDKEYDEDSKELVHTILSKELEQGKVRVESWLKADPLAILESGNIICAVHHGGANSYFEATWAGIPQVILAHWYDTYDYATRVEYLGIGVYGNRIIGHESVIDAKHYVAPLMVDAKEFAEALLKVVGREKGNAEAMRKKAKELGELCRNSGGRVEAAKIITDLASEE